MRPIGVFSVALTKSRESGISFAGAALDTDFRRGDGIAMQRIMARARCKKGNKSLIHAVKSATKV